MNIFEASRFQRVLEELRDVACSADHFCEEYRGSTELPDDGFAKRASEAVRRSIEVTRPHHFTDAERLARRAQIELLHPRDYATIRSECAHVADGICDELSKRIFFTVTPERRNYVENPAFIGKAVCDAFPSALNDIYEAGNCLGADCNTAAVFHLMRLVEWGLRALCVHLGLRNAKRGKGRRISISYVDWETMLNQLQPLVDTKIEKLKRGKAKQVAQEFYYPALQDIRAIRDAWRNHLMHARRSYSSEEAEVICGHVKNLMSRLVKRMSEQ